MDKIIYTKKMVMEEKIKTDFENLKRKNFKLQDQLATLKYNESLKQQKLNEIINDLKLNLEKEQVKIQKLNLKNSELIEEKNMAYEESVKLKIKIKLAEKEISALKENLSDLIKNNQSKDEIEFNKHHEMNLIIQNLKSENNILRQNLNDSIIQVEAIKKLCTQELNQELNKLGQKYHEKEIELRKASEIIAYMHEDYSIKMRNIIDNREQSFLKEKETLKQQYKLTIETCELEIKVLNDLVEKLKKENISFEIDSKNKIQEYKKYWNTLKSSYDKLRSKFKVLNIEKEKNLKIIKSLSEKINVKKNNEVQLKLA